MEDIDKEVIKSFYVIELSGKNEEITIGRKNNNDVILSSKDITTSRYHAVIKYIKNKGKLLIKNKSESSGTMVLIKSGYIEISDKKEIYLQSGTTFIKAKIIEEEEYNEIIKEEKTKVEDKNDELIDENKSEFAQEMENDLSSENKLNNK